ncbi:MAG: hypothetical protein JWQ78_278 [Sediminibacterium sp.]|nr:hypothetical protein [Sediminibacterium sp.]
MRQTACHPRKRFDSQQFTIFPPDLCSINGQQLYENEQVVVYNLVCGLWSVVWGLELSFGS